jgi:drug/metabolite transporter (DMT)-like permease
VYKPPVPELSLIGLTLLWGTTFTLVKLALAHASTGVFLATRFAVATAVLGAVQLVRRDRASGPAFWRHALVLGAAMLAGFVFQTVGLVYTTPARSGFITGLCVLMVPFIARFALGRPVRWSVWAGVALAVAGLLLLTRPFDAGAVTAAVRLGDFVTLFSAVAYAVQITFMSEWSPRHPLVPFTLVQVSVVLAGALLMIPIEGARLDPAGLPTFLGVIAFTGLVMTAGAIFVMNWAQRHTGAVRAALIYALEPVAAALFSQLVIGEELGVAGWIGGGLTVLGVLVGELSGVWSGRAAAVPAPAALPASDEPAEP